MSLNLRNGELTESNSLSMPTAGHSENEDQQPLLQNADSSTSIIIEGDSGSSISTSGQSMSHYYRGSNEVPQQFDESVQTSGTSDYRGSNANLSSANRSWRMNLNDVLSFSSSSTEAIRWITQSTNFGYSQLNAQDYIDAERSVQSQSNEGEIPSGRRPSNRMSRGVAQRATSNLDTNFPNTNTSQTSNATETLPQLAFGALGSTSIYQNNIELPRPQENLPPNTAQQAAGVHEENVLDNNVISNLFVKVVSHFARYLPFICILCVKFIHDHMLGLLDLLLLHGLLYHTNKSLCKQITKFSQKNYGVLVRDFSLVSLLITFRFFITSSSPDPFGLLIGPPSETVDIEISSVFKNGKKITEKTSAGDMFLGYLSDGIKSKINPTTAAASTITISNTISIGLLLYYVAVNDLMLKLLTIQIKIFATMLPTSIIRHKPRARLYVFIEYLSQFYRSFAPIHQWLLFLFNSYSNFEIISGILFSSFYMGAKGFEFVERGKSLKRSFTSYVLNMDSDHKPTREELDAAGPLCPICHEEFNSPVVLKCTHIFCDDCVSTWFKREQTCPMCRAKINDDPTWQDGSTSFFLQLC